MEIPAQGVPRPQLVLMHGEPHNDKTAVFSDLIFYDIYTTNINWVVSVFSVLYWVPRIH